MQVICKNKIKCPILIFRWSVNRNNQGNSWGHYRVERALSIRGDPDNLYNEENDVRIREAINETGPACNRLVCVRVCVSFVAAFNC